MTQPNESTQALINSDGTTFGLLALCLGFVFYTSTHPSWKKFYHYVPPLLICYLLPAILNTLGIINGEGSKIYYMASRFLLPTALVLFIISVDLKRVFALGPKALGMFFTGTAGVMIGGPIALLVGSWFWPDVVGGDFWKGMSTLAGSWIGGGANQLAMKEFWEVEQQLFSAMLTIDVLVASLWMAILLFMARRANEIDQRNGADVSSIESLRRSIQDYTAQYARIASLKDIMLIVAVGFGVTGLAHLFADILSPWLTDLKSTSKLIEFTGIYKHFFWLIFIATAAGVVLSMTKVRELEAVGSSSIASAFIYILVASIGMGIDLSQIGNLFPIFVIGLIWISIHAGLLLMVGKIIKAPTFFLAVGSQANIGGAASAPAVASAFHPSLAPVGALLAIFGYIVGTLGAWACSLMMRWIVT